ncbi:unnamed protein product [Pedinophyceae sp. YPF-701]|nr:unnamed protein product [Pedinophyceae sp. YPF-701]
MMADRRETDAQFQRGEGRFKDTEEALNNLLSKIDDAAAGLHASGRTELSKTCSEIFREVALARSESQKMRAAMQAMTSVAPDQLEDNAERLFVEFTEKRKHVGAEDCLNEVEAHEGAIWYISNPNEAFPGVQGMDDVRALIPGAAGRQPEEEDDDMMVTQAPAGAGTYLNRACPISGSALNDIREPVVDGHGYVFEKKDVVDYIRNELRHKGRCGHPVACVSGGLVLEDLKPAHKLMARLHAKELQQRWGAGA